MQVAQQVAPTIPSEWTLYIFIWCHILLLRSCGPPFSILHRPPPPFSDLFPHPQIPMILEALKRQEGLKLFISPWSPPAWMKVRSRVAFIVIVPRRRRLGGVVIVEMGCVWWWGSVLFTGGSSRATSRIPLRKCISAFFRNSEVPKFEIPH